MFQHGVDFYRTFTVVHCTEVFCLPIKKEKEITCKNSKKSNLQEENIKKVCLSHYFYINSARVELQNCIFDSYNGDSIGEQLTH